MAAGGAACRYLPGNPEGWIGVCRWRLADRTLACGAVWNDSITALLCLHAILAIAGRIDSDFLMFGETLPALSYRNDVDRPAGMAIFIVVFLHLQWFFCIKYIEYAC
jgi:hypothetical protein